MNQTLLSQDALTVDAILDRVRKMSNTAKSFIGTGDTQLDIACMLSYNEVDFMTAYAKSESAYNALSDIRQQLPIFQSAFRFTSTDENTTAETTDVFMADEIVMNTYCIIKENGLDSLDDIFNTDITIEKLSKSRVKHGDSFKTIEKTVSVIKYIDTEIQRIINSEKNHIDMNSDKLFGEVLDSNGDVIGLEEKPSKSVFQTVYTSNINSNPVIELSLDVEMQEAFTAYSKMCGFTETEARAVLLYFLHGLTISGVRKHWDGDKTDNDKTISQKRVQKYLSDAMVKISKNYEVLDFTLSQYRRIVWNGVLSQVNIIAQKTHENDVFCIAK